MDRDRHLRAFVLPAALGVYFASGFAALVYQVVWQRTLSIFSGADVHSATVVVAAFMAGLGCGSLAGGHIADRVSPVRALTWFAGAELAIALFGFGSKAIFYGILYERIGPLGLGPLTTVIVLFGTLLWPTFFMGMSLPLLTRGLVSDIHRTGSTIGSLYAVNTLGAAAGAIAATWWLLPQSGLDGAARTAAFVNLACAAVAIPLARVRVREAATAVDGPPPDVRVLAGTRSFRGWALLFGLAGFVALSLEIVWFRLLGVMLKSTAFTFGTLLAVYLTGLGAGAVVGSVLSRRVRRPALWFFLLQAAVGAYAAVSLTWFIARLPEAPMLAPFWSHFGRYDALHVPSAIAQLVSGTWPADFFRLYVLLPIALILLPTMMSGASFPLLQQVVQTDVRFVGRRLGTLLAANIVGSTIGAFLTGLGLLGWLGAAGTLRVLIAVSAIFALFAVHHVMSRRSLSALLFGCVAVVVLFGWLAVQIPPGAVLWSRLHGTGPRYIIFAEDSSGLSLVRAERDFSRTVFVVNGLGQSWIPYGGVHTILGALPALVHQDPKDAAVIGLGSGDTVYALAGRAEIERITAVEIVGSQLETLRELAAQQRLPELLALLADPRVEHVVADGRLHIRQSGRHYDIIEADALRPTSAYSGNLYSEEYFRLLRDHLKPGGLAITWAPTERVARTFLRVFPYVWQHGDILMGSNAAIEVNQAAIASRLRDPSVREHYARAHIDIEQLLVPLLSGARTFDPSFDRSNLTDINTDLHPKDEFELPSLSAVPLL